MTANTRRRPSYRNDERRGFVSPYTRPGEPTLEMKVIREPFHVEERTGVKQIHRREPQNWQQSRRNPQAPGKNQPC